MLTIRNTIYMTAFLLCLIFLYSSQWAISSDDDPKGSKKQGFLESIFESIIRDVNVSDLQLNVLSETEFINALQNETEKLFVMSRIWKNTSSIEMNEYYFFIEPIKNFNCEESEEFQPMKEVCNWTSYFEVLISGPASLTSIPIPISNGSYVVSFKIPLPGSYIVWTKLSLFNFKGIYFDLDTSTYDRRFDQGLFPDHVYQIISNGEQTLNVTESEFHVFFLSFLSYFPFHFFFLFLKKKIDQKIFFLE